jgi:ferredoxin
MPFVVTGKCIACRYTDCVEVCPVSCFYKGENMLVINPDECIDCGVCEPECPIEAIKSDDELSPTELHWSEVNRRYSSIWPNIKKSVGPLPHAETFADQTPEEKKPLFSAKPGETEK